MTIDLIFYYVLYDIILKQFNFDATLSKQASYKDEKYHLDVFCSNSFAQLNEYFLHADRLMAASKWIIYGDYGLTCMSLYL